MLHELFMTLCSHITLIMNSFTFSKDSYNHETLLETRKLKKLEIQLARKVTPKILQIKMKGNKFEQAIIRKGEC